MTKSEYRIVEKPADSGRFIIQEKKNYYPNVPASKAQWYPRSNGGPTTEYGSYGAAAKRLAILQKAAI